MPVSQPRLVALQQQRALPRGWGCSSTALPLHQEEMWSQGCFQLGSTSHQLPFKSNKKKKKKAPSLQNEINLLIYLFSYACAKARARSLETEETCLVDFLGFSLDGRDS